MSRFTRFAVVCLGLCVALPMWAQANHGEAGVFADYFRFPVGSTAINYVGVGGRAGVNINPYVELEGEMSYDFSRNYTTTYATPATGTVSTTFTTTGVRPITALFGPKLQTGSGPFRLFATGKIGFVDFSYNGSGTASGSTFSNSLPGIGGPGTHVAFYPGGGVETFLGPVGLRLDVGDEVYLANGARNNLRVTFGPTIRF